MKEFVCLAVFIILSTLFAVAMILAGFICQYKKECAVKKSTYECGVKTILDAKIPFDVKYINYAIMFLIFEIGIYAVSFFARQSRQVPKNMS